MQEQQVIDRTFEVTTADCNEDILALQTFADRAKQLEFAQKLQGRRRTVINTAWFVLARQLHFACVKKTVDIENNVAVSGAAKTSIRAAKEKTYDRGTEGFFHRLHDAGVTVSYGRASILRAEKLLESLGIVQYERARHHVAIGHINLRAAALFLEMYHPEYEDLMEKTDGLFKWLKPFCDGILDGSWRRKDPDEPIYDANHQEEDLALFQARFPSRKFDLGRLSAETFRKLMYWSGGKRFFKRKIRELYRTVCVFWDVDISNPPDECAYI